MEKNWQHQNFTEEELKEIVRGVYDCKIFTSLQCGNDNITMIFMPAMFMGSAPSTPTLGDNNQVNRKRKLQYIEDCLVYDSETPQREEFFKNIGMLYENWDKAGPRSINGFPMFMSCKIMSIECTKAFREMYMKYETMREEFEKEWGTKKAD